MDKSKELADRFIKKAVKNLEALPAIPARDYLENLTVGLEERQY